MEEPAITEIERNARWWAEHYSSHQALVWYDAAVDAIYSLESQPERHALSPENQKFDYEFLSRTYPLGIAGSVTDLGFLPRTNGSQSSLGPHRTVFH